MILLDTGSLVAALDSGDEWHAWATAKMRDLHQPARTCGAVLSEATFLVRLHPPALSRVSALVHSGAIRSAGENSALWCRATALMETYRNVPMSFADACLVAIAEQAPDSKIFTLDREFLVYRRMDGRPLALIAPFLE